MARDTLWRGSLLGEIVHRQHEIVMFGQYLLGHFPGNLLAVAGLPSPSNGFYVPVGFMFHVLILVQLNAIFIEWMAAYAVFVPWSAILRRWRERSEGVQRPGRSTPTGWSRRVERRRKTRQREAWLVYDGECPVLQRLCPLHPGPRGARRAAPDRCPSGPPGGRSGQGRRPRPRRGHGAGAWPAASTTAPIASTCLPP